MGKQSRLGWNLQEGPWEGGRGTGCPEFRGGRDGLQGEAGRETRYHFVETWCSSVNWKNRLCPVPGGLGPDRQVSPGLWECLPEVLRVVVPFSPCRNAGAPGRGCSPSLTGFSAGPRAQKSQAAAPGPSWQHTCRPAWSCRQPSRCQTGKEAKPAWGRQCGWGVKAAPVWVWPGLSASYCLMCLPVSQFLSSKMGMYAC